jgi:hypothetical protein
LSATRKPEDTLPEKDKVEEVPVEPVIPATNETTQITKDGGE